MSDLDVNDARLRLYVGHKLTNATESFLKKMDLVHKAIDRDLVGEFRILKFLGFGGTPFEVFHQDIILGVATCDLLVAIIDQESTGLGYEIGIAQGRYGKPILVIEHGGLNTSRLILGAAQHNPGSMRHVVVDGPDDVVRAIRESVEWFSLHQRRKPRVPSCRIIEDPGDPLVFDPGRGFFDTSTQP